MRTESVYQDPLVEHVFTPDQLFALMGDLQDVTLPAGFIREISHANTLTALLDTTTTWLQHILPIDRASICIPDGTGMMQIWSLRGRAATKLEKSLPAGYGRPGRVMKGQSLIISCHLRYCDQPDGKMLFKSGFERTTNAPLMFGGQCLGALNIAVERFEGLGLGEAMLLLTLASLLAPSIAALSSVEESVAKIEHQRALTQKAQTESAMKSSFIANVSHEIRTPLNAIMGMAQMLQEDGLTQPQADKVDVVLFSARTLLSVLNDILDLSKIEAGKIALNPVRHRPDHVIRQTIDLWRDKANQKGLSLTQAFEVELPGVLVFDAVRVQQCLSNLLSNAIKFTDAGEISVNIDASHDAEHTFITIRVSDTGEGILLEDAANVFDPFHQAPNSEHSNHKGTGLGLSICRSLARLMDGDVTVESVFGEGATFAFSFRGRRVSDLARSRSIDPSRVERSSQDCIPKGTRILLVEDVPTNRLVVRMLLQPHGVELEEAANGLAALELLSRSEFDIVLLDMQMPVMDGPETILRIRSEPSPYQALPVIALTASAMVGDREKFLSMGIDGYIPKPIEGADLVSEICALLN